LSKEAQYEIEIMNTSKTILDKAVNCLLTELKGQLLKTANFRIYGNGQIDVKGICIKLPEMCYPVDVYIDQNRKLVVNGDSMDVKLAAGKIQQFYEATEYSMAHKVPMVYNQKTREVELMMEVQF
jgi:hypothetical protein